MTTTAFIRSTMWLLAGVAGLASFVALAADTKSAVLAKENLLFPNHSMVPSVMKPLRDSTREQVTQWIVHERQLNEKLLRMAATLAQGSADASEVHRLMLCLAHGLAMLDGLETISRGVAIEADFDRLVVATRERGKILLSLVEGNAETRERALRDGPSKKSLAKILSDLRLRGDSFGVMINAAAEDAPR